jgi:membrane protease YdiL (CAAX protease family)
MSHHHWEFFKEQDTSFGVFYPLHYVVAAFDTPERAEEVRKAFIDAGFADDDVASATGGFAALGFHRPDSWRRIVLIAIAAAALRIVLGEFVIDPLTGMFWPPAIAPAEAEGIAGNIGQALAILLLVWTFAAFGEEISYRGYLLTRAADLGRRSTLAYWIGIVIVSILFGYGHYYKGPSGIIDSGIAGLILGVAYMASGRNLWTSILAHGFIDTFGVVVLYFGWDS